jgi:hypothetical protein
MACRCAFPLGGWGQGGCDGHAVDDLGEHTNDILGVVMVLLLFGFRVRKVSQKSVSKQSLGPQRRSLDFGIVVYGQMVEGITYGLWQVQGHASGLN